MSAKFNNNKNTKNKFSKNYKKGSATNANDKTFSQRNSRDDRRSDNYESTTDTETQKNNSKPNAGRRNSNNNKGYGNRSVTGLAGGYSYFYPVGLPEEVGTSQCVYAPAAGTPDYPMTATAKLPGIAIIWLQHTIGATTVSGEQTANAGVKAINVGLNKLYSDIRHANSGARNYEKSDLGIYMLCVADAYAFYGLMCRAYESMSKFSSVNRYYGAPLVRALGFDYDNLVKNLPAFKTYINQYAMRLNVLYIPAKWPYFQRRFSLYRDVYVDEPSEKGQLYAFNPRYLFKFKRDSEGKGCCEAAGLALTDANLDTIVDFGNSLIADIILDDDFNLMSGDIAKYTSDLFTLPYLDEGSVLEPKYDEMMLSQIENLTVEGSFSFENDIAVSQQYDQYHNDYLTFNPITETSDSSETVMRLRVFGSRMKRLFNIHTTHYDEAQVLEATRFMNMPSRVAANIDGYRVFKYYDWISTEVVSSIHIYDEVNDTYLSSYKINQNYIGSGSTYATRPENIVLNQFNHAPTFPIVTLGANSNTVIGFTGTIDNYLLFDVQDMRRLHEASVLSLFNVN